MRNPNPIRSPEAYVAECLGPDTYQGKSLRRLCAPPLVEDVEQAAAAAVRAALGDVAGAMKGLAREIEEGGR